MDARGDTKKAVGIDACALCNRKMQYIGCHSCGYVFKGRISTPCQKHPGTLYVMDILACPVCHSRRIFELAPMPESCEWECEPNLLPEKSAKVCRM